MNTNRRLIIACLVAALALVSWPAVANLVVSYTLVPVTISELVELEIRRGNEPGEVVAIGYFEVKDSGGAVRETGSATIQLNPSQTTAIVNFVNANVVPVFNAQRGL